MAIGSGLSESVNAFGAAVKSSLTSKAATAATADNALALNGQTASQIVESAKSYTDTHVNNKNNPHGTTAAQIGAFSKDEINAKLALYVPAGILPISAWNPNNVFGRATITVDNETFLFGIEAGVPTILSGTYYTPDSFSMVLPNAPWVFFYVVLENGICKYKSSLTELAESSTCMYIGKAKGWGSAPNEVELVGFNTVSGQAVVRIDNYRPSNVPAGSAIPVSSGYPSSSGSLSWT